MKVYEILSKRFHRFILGSLIVLFFSPAGATCQNRPALPPIVLNELKRLEETYRILDAVSLSIWPGWNDYREVPFLFEYENGLKVLIGHPTPPSEFKIVSGLLVGNSRVFVDSSQLSPKQLVPPLAAGGGSISFGSGADGSPQTVVAMKFAPADQLDIGDEISSPSAEQQILIYIHELFHYFQNSRIRNRTYGNLQFNADANYALYSEIEGIALYRAYSESSTEKALLRIKEFLAARQLKRSASMTDLQAKQEASDEFAEGTATYAEIKTLETLKGIDFVPMLSSQQDPMYNGFQEIDPLLRRYAERLVRASADVDFPYGKSYTYGAFQALLSDRVLPNWKSSLLAESPFIDEQLRMRFAIGSDETREIDRSLERQYPLDKIRQRNNVYFAARDSAYQAMNRRIGRVYVIDFKATGQYLATLADKKRSYSLGLIQLFPEGLGPIQFDDVSLSRVRGPAEINQLYYIRCIDNLVRKPKNRFVVKGLKQLDGSWKRATVQTPVFTLRAPHIAIRTGGNLVKIRVLARVG
jgi:hypothetical protein